MDAQASRSSSSISRGTPCSSHEHRRSASARRARAPSPRSSAQFARIARKYNRRMKSLWNDAEARAVRRPARPARLYLAPARARQVAGAARRRQHLGQAAREGRLRRGARRPLREGQRLRPRDDRARRASRRSPRPYADGSPACRRSSDPQMVNELNTHALRAGAPFALGRDAAARHPAAPVRRPHARRRGALGLATRPTARSASARSTASASR